MIAGAVRDELRDRFAMAGVFISYVSSDRERAEALADRLAGRGYSVWWDRTIPPGRVFDEVIQEALHAARCVIVLWSAQSVRSNWVKTEAAEGMSAGRLVPALIERVSPPIEFKRIQAADLTDWSGDDDALEYQKLLASVDAMLERPSVAREVPPPPISLHPTAWLPPRNVLRRPWAVTGVLILAMAVGGGYLLGRRSSESTTRVEGGFAPPEESAGVTESGAAAGERPQGSDSPAAPTTPQAAGRVNLLSAENGGEIVTASHELWSRTIDGREETSTYIDLGEAVFAFKDGRAATFDTFTVLIPGAGDLNLAEFELLVGDAPNGPFTSLGMFMTQNTRIMKQPYQEFRFAPTRAKFLKVRPLKNHRGGGVISGSEFQLFGRLE